MAGHGQHHTQSLLCHGHGIRPRSVHHGNALVRGRVEIDVVDSHTSASDHTQFFGMLKKRRVRLYRRADNQCVRRLQMGRQLAVKLVPGEHGPARLLELIDCRC